VYRFITLRTDFIPLVVLEKLAEAVQSAEDVVTRVAVKLHRLLQAAPLEVLLAAQALHDCSALCSERSSTIGLQRNRLRSGCPRHFSSFKRRISELFSWLVRGIYELFSWLFWGINELFLGIEIGMKLTKVATLVLIRSHHPPDY
jgi:hypothetical protein